MDRTGEICGIARGLQVVGQKWTLLIIREASLGRTRFSEFRTALGVATDVLAARLATLVEEGLLERRRYRDEGARERDEYLLTDAGRDLLPVLAALAAWGNEHRPSRYGASPLYVERESGAPVRLAFVDERGAEVERDALAVRTIDPATVR